MSHNQHTSEIHCKNVPRGVDKQRWYKFVNKHVKNKKWIRHYKNNNEWIIVVKSHEKHDWKSALTNKTINQQRITVYIKEGRNNHRQSAFHHRNEKHFRTSSHKGGAVNHNRKYTKCFTKHLSKKQQNDMLSLCGKRYAADSRMLNLSAIVDTEQDDWASFSNFSFVSHLLSIIKDNCSDVKSIDLSKNNIQTLEGLKTLIECAPFLENLSLLDNDITSLSELNYLNGLRNNLRELYLRNLNLLNEVCGIKHCYVFEIMRIFDNLRLLDGENVSNTNGKQSLVCFGSSIDDFVSTSSAQLSVPVSVHSVCDQIQPMITSFIEKYYALFDSHNNRRKLFNLYHTDAVFTLTYCPTIDTPTPTENRSNDFKSVNSSCNRINRNLIDGIFMKQARYKRMNKVKYGNLDICKYLSDDFVQRTKHQINYMSIDCHPIKLNDEQFMNVVINGYYAENQCVARKFNRTWILIQQMNEIQIVNDQLHLGGVVPQSKLLKHVPASCIADIDKQSKKQTNNNNNNNGFAVAVNANVNVNGNANANNNQQDLVQKVSNHCGVPIHISRQALEASNWDPQVAVTKIETLKSQRNTQQQ